MKLFLVLGLISLQAFSSDLVVKGGGFVPKKIGNIDLVRTDKGYEILKGTQRIQVKPYDVDPLLSKLSKEKLAVFLQEGHGYTSISQLSNGDYKVKAHVRGLGGGPATGQAFYWITKSICYGVMIAGVTVGLIEAGRKIGGEPGAVVAGGVSTAISATASPQSTIIAGGLSSNATTSEASRQVAVATISATGGAVAGYVESIALAAGAIGSSLPTP